jgi:hypothetical protein
MPEFPIDVAEQLKILPGMSAPALRTLWEKTFGKPHPAWMHHGFLVRALAYHFQEKAYGAMGAALRKRLRAYAEEMKAKGAITSLERLKIKPGTRLVREWRGDTHVVTAQDSDFDYRGKRYQSLSEIARAITGTRWSGPAFFGLKTAPAGRKRNAGRA